MNKLQTVAKDMITEMEIPDEVMAKLEELYPAVGEVPTV